MSILSLLSLQFQKVVNTKIVALEDIIIGIITTMSFTLLMRQKLIKQIDNDDQFTSKRHKSYTVQVYHSEHEQ